eukprot:TRINITY_DN2851_c0_g2_i1.p1 TRINITY_DN2851_c0_g2~~TRINITY_DN2851_c0_g2_i1.p1  ORF type:complete len:539 (+),score=189.16 TRINITY_DN2851_c0_g2_i1:35-1618(+)
MPAAGTSTANEDTGGLWGQLLSSVLKKTQVSTTKTIIMLGDRHSGKTTLLMRLRGQEISPTTDLSTGTALDYSFLEVTEEETDDVIARINVWQLEGDENVGKGMLNLAVNASTLEDTLALIVVDLSQPWKAARSLKKWLAVLENHVESIKETLRPKGLLEDLKAGQIARWQKYKEPDLSAGKKRRKQFLTHKNVGKETKAGEQPTTTTQQEQVLLPLAAETLSNNLGIPIVVVCSKADTCEQLQKDFDFKDGRLDYIQAYLRRICLNYGAGLIYLSAKKEQERVEILREYIEDLFFGFGFDHTTNLLEKDTVFVPAGWDSLDKIMIDFKSQKVATDLDQPFEDVIKLPPNLVRQQEMEAAAAISAQEDQEYLSKYLDLIEKEEKEAEASPNKEDGMIKSLRKIGNDEDISLLSSPTPKDNKLTSSKPATPLLSGSAAALLAQTPPRRIFSQEPVQASPKTPGIQTDNAALASFFNNLLNKSTKKAEPSSSSRKPQRQDIEKELQKIRQSSLPQGGGNSGGGNATPPQ